MDSSNVAYSSAPTMQRRPWRSYFTLEAMTRTKSVAQVMYEAAEEEQELDGVSADIAAEKVAETVNGSAAPSPAPAATGGLAKVLTVWDLMAYGIGSTLGAGIFAITAAGTKAAGPAIVLSFIVAAVACLFSAFSYMEFAARVPIAGSAYTFSYVVLGELAAWFVGWNLTLEYAISAAVVARTWTGNLQLFIENIGGSTPDWLFLQPVDGGVISKLSLMSALICLFCMGILLIGVKESSNFNMFITSLNVIVILFIIILGSFHVDTANWTAVDPEVLAVNPDAKPTYFPFGVNGIITGAAVVFFSYIGFDSVTTLAEEVKNPKRDLPIGIIATLIISTILYIATAIVITGMEPWYKVKAEDVPLARVFENVGLKWASTLILAASVTSLTGNTLTSLFGQPRIFYRMAKDGLLFSPFARIHPTTKAPTWGTIFTGVGAAIIAFLLPVDTLSNMISIGTLLAFSVVCAGVVILRYEKMTPEQHQQLANDDLTGSPQSALLPSVVAAGSGPYSAVPLDNGGYGASDLSSAVPVSRMRALFANLRQSAVFWLGVFMIPCVGFCVALRHADECPIPVTVILGLLTCVPVFIIWRLPLNPANKPRAGAFECPLVPFLPCLGIFTNTYLICSLDVWSYVRVVIWTAIGMAIYFGYGIFHSTLLEKLTKYQASLAEKAAAANAPVGITVESTSRRSSFGEVPPISRQHF